MDNGGIEMEKMLETILMEMREGFKRQGERLDNLAKEVTEIKQIVTRIEVSQQEEVVAMLRKNIQT